MKLIAIGMALCLGLSACGSGGSTPPAQQASANSGPVSGSTAGAQINAIRARVGLPALTRNATLDAAARAHANDMVKNNFFAHEGSDGSSSSQRVTRAGYRWCTVGENISVGYSSSSSSIESWRTSPGHYRNIVSRKAKEYGLANVGKYWVMLVAAKKC